MKGLKLEAGNMKYAELQGVVELEWGKKENRTLPSGVTRFRDFLDRYNSSDVYLVTDVPEVCKASMY